VFCSTCGARIRNSQGICIRCEDPQERDAVGATAKEVGSVSDSPEPESVKSDAVAPNSAGSPLSASATSNPVNTTGKLFLKLFFGLIGIFAIIIGLIEITSQQQRNDSRTSNKLREAVPIPASNQSQPQTARPLIPPPKFRIYKFKNDGISPTSVVVPINTTDDQLKSLIWFFREKVRSHDFKSLKVKEARDGMFAVYRGEKCANEQFIDASGPCGDGEHDDAFYQWGIEADPNKDSGSIKVKGDFVVVFNYEDGWQVAPLR
jgi:hypothetical protein